MNLFCYTVMAVIKRVYHIILLYLDCTGRKINTASRSARSKLNLSEVVATRSKICDVFIMRAEDWGINNESLQHDNIIDV